MCALAPVPRIPQWLPHPPQAALGRPETARPCARRQTAAQGTTHRESAHGLPRPIFWADLPIKICGKCLILRGTVGWARTTDLLFHRQAL
jgi:hypothetical protein